MCVSPLSFHPRDVTAAVSSIASAYLSRTTKVRNLSFPPTAHHLSIRLAIVINSGRIQSRKSSDFHVRVGDQYELFSPFPYRLICDVNSSVPIALP